MIPLLDAYQTVANQQMPKLAVATYSATVHATDTAMFGIFSSYELRASAPKSVIRRKLTVMPTEFVTIKVRRPTASMSNQAKVMSRRYER